MTAEVSIEVLAESRKSDAAGATSTARIAPVIDKDLRVIAGHGRLLAAQKLGWTQVPTICLEHLTKAQKRAFMIADNRLTENSTWDDDLLGQELKELAALDLDFDLEATGFESADIDLRIGNLDGQDERDDADEVVVDEGLPVVSRSGDLWLLGEHRVYCGNSLEENTYSLLMQGGQRKKGDGTVGYVSH